jgi:hypothetical protein
VETPEQLLALIFIMESEHHHLPMVIIETHNIVRKRNRIPDIFC